MAGIGHNQPSISLDGLSQEDRKVLRKAILELNDSMTRVGAERELQAEIVKDVFDKLGADKKLVKRMATSYYKANFKDVVEENEIFENFYNTIIHNTAS